MGNLVQRLSKAQWESLGAGILSLGFGGVGLAVSGSSDVQRLARGPVGLFLWLLLAVAVLVLLAWGSSRIIGSIFPRGLSPEAQFQLSSMTTLFMILGLFFVALPKIIERPDLESFSVTIGFVAVIVSAGSAEISRRHILGDLFYSARLGAVQFFVPDPQKHKVDELSSVQVSGQEIPLPDGMEFPAGASMPAFVWLHFKANQTLLRIYFRFADEGDKEKDELGKGTAFATLPRFEPRLEPGYERMVIGASPATHVFGWHNDYQVVYPNGRLVTANTWMPVAFRLRGVGPGVFKLRIRVYVKEARRHEERILSVKCSAV